MIRAISSEERKTKRMANLTGESTSPNLVRVLDQWSKTGGGDPQYGASRDPNPNVPQFTKGGRSVDYLRQPPAFHSAINGEPTPGNGTQGQMPDFARIRSIHQGIKPQPDDGSMSIHIPKMVATRDIFREKELLIQQDVKLVSRDGKTYRYVVGNSGAQYFSYYPPETYQWSRGP